MDSKLTLKLNRYVIERAKKYASEKQLSLSRLIENYLNSLTTEQREVPDISPFVKSIATGKSVPANIEEKSLHGDYIDHQNQKHQ